MNDKTPTRRAAIFGAVRIPFARAYTVYADLGNLDLLSATVKSLVDRYQLNGVRLGDCTAGATLTDPREWNLMREAVLSSGLAPETPAFDLARACGTSAEATIAIANKIALGQIESGIAAGVDSISATPLLWSHAISRRFMRMSRARTLGQRLSAWKGFRFRELKPVPPRITERQTGLNMGESCELMAKHWKISRLDQDTLALVSHEKATAAWNEGFYQDLVVSFHGSDRDNNVRPDTSLEKLSALKPAYDRTGTGTLTAGNSTPLTDGAAAVLLGSDDWGHARGLSPWAHVVDAEVSAVDFFRKGEGLLMAPVYAVPRLLARQGLRLGDFDFYEIHEAFAAQTLCALRAWESDSFCRDNLGLPAALGSIDLAKLNVKGGSVALGHPFGATGARIVGTLAKLLANRGRGRGLISICTGGGMGVTLILER
jgi:acetyl-CoA C-acetyltransferase